MGINLLVIVRAVMRRMLGFATGIDFRGLFRQQGLMELALSSDHAAWLYRNRAERMDATVRGLYHPLRQEFHLARYRFAAQRVQGMSVADIACGCGYGTKMLRVDGGATKCVGVDLEPLAIAYAKDVHQVTAVSFMVASGEDTGLTAASFDAVISFETIEHVRDPVRLLGEFARLLRPGGCLIVSTPNDWALEDAPYHLQRFTEHSFREALSRDFELREIWAQNSGSRSIYNRGRKASLVPGTPSTLATAEVFVAVCSRR